MYDHPRTPSCLPLIASAFILGGASAARAQILFQHLGSSDPVVAEGWVGGALGPGVTVGPVTTGSPPVDAWFIYDNSAALGSGGGYQRTLTPCEAAAANAYGWTLRVCLRINDPDSDATIWCGFGNGSRRYSMWFRSNAAGQPIVTMQDGISTICSVLGTEHVVTGATDCHVAGFHLYELVFDPAGNNADFLVDGAPAVLNYTGLGLATVQQVSWGAGASCADGYAEFRLLQFELHGSATLGDLNCDCVVNPGDVPFFVTALVDPAAFASMPGSCMIERADMNQDGQIDGRDVAVFVSAVVD